MLLTEDLRIAALHDIDRDVAAFVRDMLYVCEHRLEVDALDRIADLIDHPEYVPGVQLFDHVVNNFFQRLHLCGKL